MGLLSTNPVLNKVKIVVSDEISIAVLNENRIGVVEAPLPYLVPENFCLSRR